MEVKANYSSQSGPQYYNYSYDAPDAIVLLNRGTNYEQDITADVISASTNHSIESVVGSFNITLDNTNDRFVDRFGRVFIKKMSSVEIFVKSFDDSLKSKGPLTAEGSVYIPQKLNPKNDQDVGNLTELVVNQYFKGLDESEKTKVITDIISLNQNLSNPQPAYKINLVNIAQQSALFKEITATDNAVTFVFTDEKKKDVVIDAAVMENTQSTIGFIPKVDQQNKINQVGSALIGTSYSVPFNVDPTDFISPTKERMDLLRKFPIKIPPSPITYQRIFLGIVLNVTQNISPGAGMTIAINGKTNGYWLESSVVNIFPGGFEKTLNNLELSVTANRYAAMHAIDIFKELIKLSTSDIITVTDFNIQNIGTVRETLLLLAKQPKLDANGKPVESSENGRPINYKSDLPTAQLTELDEAATKLLEAIPFDPGGNKTSKAPTDSYMILVNTYKTDKDDLTKKNKIVQDIKATFNIAVTQAPPYKRVIAKQTYDATLSAATKTRDAAQKKAADDIAAMKKDPWYQEQMAAINKSRKQVQKDLATLTQSGRIKFLDQFNIIEHWKQIFSQNVLEVVDQNNFLNLVYPFKLDQRSVEASMDGDYVSKADLSRTIADQLLYEFYMDTNGHFVLKPPLYNIGVEFDNPTYVIKDTDIISMNINDSAEGIITRIGVTGDYVEAANVTLEKPQIYNIYQDMTLIRDYGFHAHEIANRMFLLNYADCRDFGKSYMAKNNMGLFSASVTIIGRPEIRLGVSVYLEPRDTVFYISEISHEITAGGEFRTTLTLIGGRRIVTGFKAETQVNNFEIYYDEKTKLKHVKKSDDTKKITHYVLSDSVYQQSINKLGANNAARTSFDYVEVTGEKDTFEDLTNDSGKTPRVLINVWQIIQHVDPSLIGLIVDNNSTALSDINIANYNLIKKLNKTNFPTTARDLKIPDKVLEPALGIIKRSFDEFLKQSGIVDSTPIKIGTRGSGRDAEGGLQLFASSGLQQLPEGIDFTISKKEDFIIAFITDTKILLDTAKNNTKAKPGGILSFLDSSWTSDPTKKEIIASACVAFNVVISVLDNNGSYRQYTDGTGREYPAYLDFGKSLIIRDGQTTVNQTKSINEAAKAKEDRAKAQAQAMKGTGAAPTQSQIDASRMAILLKFQKELSDVGVNEIKAKFESNERGTNPNTPQVDAPG